MLNQKTLKHVEDAQTQDIEEEVMEEEVEESMDQEPELSSADSEMTDSEATEPASSDAAMQRIPMLPINQKLLKRKRILSVSFDLRWCAQHDRPRSCQRRR